MNSIERRNVLESPRPAVLWQDEGQYMMLPQRDLLFTSTARSSRVANVMLTQSISGVISQLGGAAGKFEADAYLSNYSSKIFHANTDSTTNEYAANLIGRCKQFMISGNNNYEGFNAMSVTGNQTGGSAGISEVFEWEVQPREFTRLKTGGPENRGVVEAIAVRNGGPFKANNRNWMRVNFQQG